MALVELGRKEHQEALPESGLGASRASMSYRRRRSGSRVHSPKRFICDGTNSCAQPTPTLDHAYSLDQRLYALLKNTAFATAR